MCVVVVVRKRGGVEGRRDVWGRAEEAFVGAQVLGQRWRTEGQGREGAPGGEAPLGEGRGAQGVAEPRGRAAYVGGPKSRTHGVWGLGAPVEGLRSRTHAAVGVERTRRTWGRLWKDGGAGRSRQWG